MNVMQITHQNAEATMPLIVPVIVLPNTPEEVGNAQIRANGALDLPWLDSVEPHDGVAVICGGGPSLRDHKDDLRRLSMGGATFFGLNAASRLLWRFGGIDVHFQVIVDAKEETAALVDTLAHNRLYASQVHPDTASRADMLFHLANIGIEDLLPPERVAGGGYTLVGGGVSVGITALCVAYTLGFRRFHLFGYDSSNRGEATHAYDQPMNTLIPQIAVEWAGKTYQASMPMKLQAEAFPKFADALIEEGCEITVHGDGLLPAIWNSEPMTEQEKYQRLWMDPQYRRWSPGEDQVAKFIEVAKPEGMVIDFGCGTGRAALSMVERGLSVLLVDFTDNCRDRAALILPFVQWDLTEPLPVEGKFGFCADVLEHIPTDVVPTVIRNIMHAGKRVFFQISTVPDKFGATIGQKLHLTVKPHEWWRDQFEYLGLGIGRYRGGVQGYRISWQEERPSASCFYVEEI